MSQAELERFAMAVQALPQLAASYGEASNAADLAVRLRSDGYGVTDAEVAASLERGAELSDSQLDQVSGGLVAELAATAVGLAGLGILGGVVAGIVATAHRNGTIPKG